MTTSLYVSGAGASARLRELEITANNLANASTEGYRADTATFREALSASLAGDRSGAPLHVFTGTSGQSTRHHSGAFQKTGAPLDAAIDGEGFFEVQTGQGTAYTRSGSFRVDRNGLLVTPDGNAVLGESGPIAIGPVPAKIQSDGRLVGEDGAELGRISLVRFEDASELSKRGANLFEAPALARRIPVEQIQLTPGGVEGSNVETMKELAQLVSLQRAFDASIQALEADDSASRNLFEEVSR